MRWTDLKSVLESRGRMDRPALQSIGWPTGQQFPAISPKQSARGGSDANPRGLAPASEVPHAHAVGGSQGEEGSIGRYVPFQWGAFAIPESIEESVIFRTRDDS